MGDLLLCFTRSVANIWGDRNQKYTNDARIFHILHSSQYGSVSRVTGESEAI